MAKKKATTVKKKAPTKTRSTAAKPAAKKGAAPVFPSTGFWLMKSEPESYSIAQFKRDEQTLWTGVRNYQARNFMMHSMKAGDQFLFYHSNAEPTGVVGVGEIAKPNVADTSALDAKSDYYDAKSSKDHPIWFCAEVKFVEEFKTCVTLADIRAEKSLAAMPLLAPGQRLSIQPVTAAEFKKISEMARA